FSILITSAPRSPRYWPQVGPARCRPRSRTRMPESGMICPLSLAMIPPLSPGPAVIAPTTSATPQQPAYSVLRTCGEPTAVGAVPAWVPRHAAFSLSAPDRLAPVEEGIDPLAEVVAQVGAEDEVVGARRAAG